MTPTADPTHVHVEFHSDGHMIVHRTASDGSKEQVEYGQTPTGTLLLIMTANPGGTGLLNAQGMHDLSTRQGAYFRIEIQRIY